MYLGIDLGTSGVKALLIDDGQTVVGSAHGELDVSRPIRAGANRTRPSGSKPAALQSMACARPIRKNFRRLPVSAFPGRCTALPCWTNRIRCCAPASSGTIRAAIAKRPNSMPIRPFAPSPAISSFPALPPRNWSGLPRTNRRFLRASARCCCRRTICACG